MAIALLFIYEAGRLEQNSLRSAHFTRNTSYTYKATTTKSSVINELVIIKIVNLLILSLFVRPLVLNSNFSGLYRMLLLTVARKMS